MLAIRGPERLVRPGPRPAGRRPRGPPGRDRLPGRPQRRRQDDDAALRHGPGGPPHRPRDVRRPRPLLGRPAHIRNGLGLGYVPEERRIVPGMTVRDNLRLGLLAAAVRRPGAGGDRRGRREIFPRLAERLDQTAVTMSGGEQQMLAIARAMVSRPKLIMLDEPSEGIMPVLVDEMMALFSRHARRRARRCCWWSRTWSLALAHRRPGVRAGRRRNRASRHRRGAAGGRGGEGALLLGVMAPPAPSPSGIGSGRGGLGCGAGSGDCCGNTVRVR